jgi:hypothetical protein
MNIASSRKARFFPHTEPAWFASGLALLPLTALVALVEPLALLFRVVSRTYNEGWNAFWADTAFHDGALYVSVDSPITNNYPPLSFHLVGFVGSVLGDNVIAGRLVALASLGVVVVAVFFWLRATGAVRHIAAAGSVFVLVVFATYGSNYIAMNDPQMLAHAFMLSALLLIWRLDFSRVAVIAGATLMLLGGFTKHLLIPLPVAVTVWLAIYRRDRLALWLACFAVGIPLGFWLTISRYPLFVADLLSARVYDIYQLASATRHAVLRFLPLLVIGALPIMRWVRTSRSATMSPQIVFALLYVASSLIIGSIASGGEGVTRNAFFDLLIASSLSAALGLEWLWTHYREPRVLRLSPAPALVVMLGALMALYAISLVPRTLGELHEADALEQDTRTMVQMIERVGKGHAACETLALCYWARAPFTIDFFNYGQKLRTGAVPIESCTAALQRGEFSVLQLELNEHGGDRLGPCAPAIEQYYTVAYRSRAGMLLVPKEGVAGL